MNPKSEKEMFTRLAILDTYCDTDLYRDHYLRAHKKISDLYKRHTLYADGTTAVRYTEKDFNDGAGKIIKRLDEETFITHGLILNNEGFQVSPVSKADYLPFDLVDKQADAGFVTLRFNIQGSINEQLDIAKSRLKKKRAQFKKSLVIDDSTSRQNINTVLDNLEIMAIRDTMVRQNGKKATWQIVADEIGINADTAKQKYKRAKDLILTKEITRFFPQK